MTATVRSSANSETFSTTTDRCFSLGESTVVWIQAAAGIVYGVLFLLGSTCNYTTFDPDVGPVLGAWCKLVGSVMFLVMSVQELLPLYWVMMSTLVDDDRIDEFFEKRGFTMSHQVSILYGSMNNDQKKETSSSYAHRSSRSLVGGTGKSRSRIKSVLAESLALSFVVERNESGYEDDTSTSSEKTTKRRRNRKLNKEGVGQFVNSLMYSVSAVLFVVGSIYFFPDVYAENKTLGLHLFIIASFIYWLAASWDTARLLKRGEVKQYLDFWILYLPVLGTVFFIIGCLFFYPRYLREDYDVDFATTWFVLGSSLFLLSSLLKPISIVKVLKKVGEEMEEFVDKSNRNLFGQEAKL